MTPIEAQLKHPELYALAKSICDEKGTTMLSIRNSVNIADIAVKNGIIISLYKKQGYRVSNAIADITKTTPEYVKRVIKTMQEARETPVKTWRYG